MFVKKGIELKLKTSTELSFDKSLFFNGNTFFKGSRRLTKQMLTTTKKIMVPVNCELKNGFFFFIKTFYFCCCCQKKLCSV